MGIKAVSAPVLASETAVRFWRGSIVLAWQLWYVASLSIQGFSLIPVGLHVVSSWGLSLIWQ